MSNKFTSLLVAGLFSGLGLGPAPAHAPAAERLRPPVEEILSQGKGQVGLVGQDGGEVATLAEAGDVSHDPLGIAMALAESKAIGPGRSGPAGEQTASGEPDDADVEAILQVSGLDGDGLGAGLFAKVAGLARGGHGAGGGHQDDALFDEGPAGPGLDWGQQDPESGDGGHFDLVFDDFFRSLAGNPFPPGLLPQSLPNPPASNGAPGSGAPPGTPPRSPQSPVSGAGFDPGFDPGFGQGGIPRRPTMLSMPAPGPDSDAPGEQNPGVQTLAALTLPIAPPPAAVPEPGVFSLLGLGWLVLGLSRRLRPA